MANSLDSHGDRPRARPMLDVEVVDADLTTIEAMGLNYEGDYRRGWIDAIQTVRERILDGMDADPSEPSD